MYIHIEIHIIGSSTLRKFDISFNPIGDEGMQVVTKVIQSNNVLTKLNVESCELSVQGNLNLFVTFYVHLTNKVKNIKEGRICSY